MRLNNFKIRPYFNHLYNLYKSGGYRKDFFSFSVGFFVTALFALLTSVLVNKNLTKTELGEFSFYKATFELLSYGLTLLVYRSYLRYNSKGISGYTLRLVKRISIAAIIVLSAIIFYVTENVFCIIFSLFVIYEERIYFFRSVLNTKSLNILRIGAAVVTSIIILFFVLFQEINSNLIFIAYGVGFAIGLFMYTKKQDVLDDFDTLKARDILMFSIPALLALLIKLSIEYNVQFTIKEYFGFEELSKLSIAIRVMLSVRMFSNLINMFYPSVYFRELEKGNFKKVLKIRRYMVFVVIIVTIIAFLVPNQLYYLMGAEKYIEHVYLFRILLISELFFTLSNFYGIYLTHIFKTFLSLSIYGAAAVINLLVLFSTIKFIGISSAVYAILASNFFLFCFHFLYTRRKEQSYIVSLGK